MKNGRALALMLILACALNLAGCASAQQQKQTAIGFYLDTVITLTAYVDDAAVLNDALEECGRYEKLLSRTVEGSDVWEYSVTEIRRVTEARSDPAWELIGESYDWLETDSATVEYAQFPAGFDVSSGIFKRYGELPPNEENTALRRVVYNSSEITGYIMWHWSPRFTGDPISDSPVSDRRTDECPLFTAFYTASAITGDTDPSGGVRPGLIYHNRGSDSDVSWWWYGGADLPIRTVSYTVTELKYVYEYRVTAIKESDSEPQDLENVSDVVHYVKYYLEQN